MGLVQEPGQHVLGDLTRHHAPQFGNEQVMLQTSQVLEVKPYFPL